MDRERERLPNRRAAERFDIVCRGQTYVVGVGYQPVNGNLYGKISEIFLDAGKAGTDLRLTAHALAIVASLALQYGCPLDVMRRALPRTEGGQAEDILGTALDYLAESDANVQTAIAAE